VQRYSERCGRCEVFEMKSEPSWSLARWMMWGREAEPHVNGMEMFQSLSRANILRDQSESVRICSKVLLYFISKSKHIRVGELDDIRLPI
jgi:hypothetical protein